MAEILKQYGKTIAACIVGILIFGIVFHMQIDGHTGFINIAYTKAATTLDSKEVTAYTDKDAVKAVLTGNKPVIVFTYSKLSMGTAVNLDQMFSATDADGQTVIVEITDVLNADGNSILYLSEDDRKNRIFSYSTSSFIFSSAGIYTLYVKAVDKENRITYTEYRIPVVNE